MVDFESNNPPDYSNSYINSLLSQFFPDIRNKDFKLIHHGTYNVYEVKSEFIFRFPDITIPKDKAWDLIKSEIGKLNILRKNLTCPIPEPNFISKDENNPFVGYTKIPGISISKSFAKIPLDNRLILAKDIGRFLTELHSQKIVDAFSKFDSHISKYSPNFLKNQWEKKFIEIKKKIFPLISEKSLINHIDNLVSDFINDEENFKFLSCITHQDFDTSNILVDEQNFRLTAVIDFEDCGIGDPAYDFPFVYEGKEFLETVLNNYRVKTDDRLKIRMKFYYHRMGVEYVLYGVDHNKNSMVKYGLQKLKENQKYPFENF